MILNKFKKCSSKKDRQWHDMSIFSKLKINRKIYKIKIIKNRAYQVERKVKRKFSKVWSTQMSKFLYLNQAQWSMSLKDRHFRSEAHKRENFG